MPTRRQARRLLTLATVLGAHLIVIWLLLSSRQLSVKTQLGALQLAWIPQESLSKITPEQSAPPQRSSKPFRNIALIARPRPIPLPHHRVKEITPSIQRPIGPKNYSWLRRTPSPKSLRSKSTTAISRTYFRRNLSNRRSLPGTMPPPTGLKGFRRAGY